MHRIDHATRAIDANGPGKDGFTEGTPGVVPATVVTDDWANAVQEEIANTIEIRGGVLNKPDNTQLATLVGTPINVLVARFNAAGEVVITDATGTPTTLNGLKEISAAGGAPEDGDAAWSQVDPEYVRSEVDGARYLFDLACVPRDATIIEVRAIVTPGASRSDGNRMSIELRAMTYGTVAVPALVTTTVASGFGTANPQPNSFQHVSLVIPIGVRVPISEGDTWQVIVQASTLDGGTNKDRVYAVQVFYTVPKLSAS